MQQRQKVEGNPASAGRKEGSAHAAFRAVNREVDDIRMYVFLCLFHARPKSSYFFLTSLSYSFQTVIDYQGSGQSRRSGIQSILLSAFAKLK